MATEEGAQDPVQAESVPETPLEANLRALEALVPRLAAAVAAQRPAPTGLSGPGPDLAQKAAAAWMTGMAHDPARLMAAGAEFWGRTLALAAQGPLARPAGPAGERPKDRRFANPLWDTHPFFRLVREQYLINADAVRTAVGALEGLDERTRRRLDYFARQMVDALAPTNFLHTNPDALERAVATDGQSLLDGLQNLVHDLESSPAGPVVRLADETAFRVGESLATTPGEVVHQSRLFELIQYRPLTEEVRRVPLVIVPPWINKFYVLDLKAQNSLVRWLVEQGYTVFVVSWADPDPSFRDVSMTDYVERGFLEAFAAARAVCGTKSVNAVGYCIAGTTLAITLALMRRRGEKGVASATFLTTLTDFSDQGEVGVFLDDDFVDAIEARAREAGILERVFMQRTFSYLRSNDLVYAPAIRSYMMGEKPPAFDLLYWNGDSTNLPAEMAVDYLRNLCQADRLAQGGFRVAGETVHLRDVAVPLCAVACETDHIAAWKSSFRGVQRMGSGDKTFILSESGHIAGIVNPPSKGKYGHWTSASLEGTPEAWQAGAEKHAGSWWPRWEAWLRERSGRLVPAREPGASLGPAPGRYVLGERAGVAAAATTGATTGG